MINNFFYNLALFRDKYFLPYKEQLHTACFARLPDLVQLSRRKPESDGLLLGIGRFNRILQVRPTPLRRELGNMLVIAPPRGGKSILAVSQLLTWKGSVIANDIKGELYNETAGYRRKLGIVFVIDPTNNLNKYDPLLNRITEHQLLSAATNLLHKPNEGEGAIFTQRAIVMLTQLFLAAGIEHENHFAYINTMIRQGLYFTAMKLHT